jgi:hypothetical protein
MPNETLPPQKPFRDTRAFDAILVGAVLFFSLIAGFSLAVFLARVGA